MLTLTFEAITIVARITAGQSAAEWLEETRPPLLLQIHHMFWSVPLILLALLLSSRPRIAIVLWSVSLALILSDLMHHFVVLPLWVGNTGWHWP
ncbi:MAG: hypothetical protein R3C19_00150 [Planctomycetaceae bacterium]